MTKGNYDVNDAYTKQNDTSYRNCICAMLIFIGMCILIVLLATLIPYGDSPKSTDHRDDPSSADAVHGDGFRTTQRTTRHSLLVTKLTTAIPKVRTTLIRLIQLRPTTPTKTTQKIMTQPVEDASADVTTHRLGNITTTPPRYATQGVIVETRFGNENAETVTGSKNTTSTPEKKQPLIVLPGFEGSTEYSSERLTEDDYEVDTSETPVFRGAEEETANGQTIGTVDGEESSVGNIGSFTTRKSKIGDSSEEGDLTETTLKGFYGTITDDDDDGITKKYLIENTTNLSITSTSHQGLIGIIPDKKGTTAKPLIGNTTKQDDPIKATTSTTPKGLLVIIPDKNGTTRTPLIGSTTKQDDPIKTTTPKGLLVIIPGDDGTTTKPLIGNSTKQIDPIRTTSTSQQGLLGIIPDKDGTTRTPLIGSTTKQVDPIKATTSKGLLVIIPDKNGTTRTPLIGSTTKQDDPIKTTTPKGLLVSIPGDDGTTTKPLIGNSTKQIDPIRTTSTSHRGLLGVFPVDDETTETALIGNGTKTTVGLESTSPTIKPPSVVIANDDETTEKEEFTTVTQEEFPLSTESESTDAVTYDVTIEEDEISSTVDQVGSLSRNQVNESLTIEKRSGEEDEDEVVSEFAGSSLEDDVSPVSEWAGEEDSQMSKILLTNTTECKTKTCTSTISRILSLMDHSEDACHDFYEYSCGGRSDPEDDRLADVRNQFHNLLDGIDGKNAPNFLKGFKSFYESCASYEDGFQYRRRLNSVREIINNIGQFILNDTVAVDKAVLTKLFAKSILIGSFPVLKVDIDVDSKTSKYILQITLPNRNIDSENMMSDWSALLEDERECLAKRIGRTNETLDLHEAYNSHLLCRRQYLKYAAAVENVIFEMNFFAEMDEYNATQNIQEILFGLETDVMKLVESVDVTDIQKAAVRQEYEEVKVSDLQKTCDVIDWRLFFEELTGNPVSDEMLLRVSFYKKIQEIMWIFKTRLNNNKLYNLLLILYATDVYQNTVMPRHKDDRKKYCLDLSSHLFSDVSAYIYVNSRSDTKSTKRQEETLTKIFDILRKDMIDSLGSSEWLDEDDDKKSLIAKARDLKPVTVSADADCLDARKLTEKYDKIEMGRNFSLDLVALKEYREKNLFSLAGKDFDEREMFCYFLRPFDVRPKSFYANGAIAVPNGLISQIPLDVPGYVLMARVGIHLAQEIARHFDPIGIKMGKPLSSAAMGEYGRLEERLDFERERIVNKQTVKFEELTDLTINREIADNAAVKMVRDTYDRWDNNIDLPWIRESFSKEQIFFVAVAQEFCRTTTTVDYMLHIYERETLPPAMRVEVMFANSKRFSEAFKCAEGTIMNSETILRMQFPHLDETNE